MFRKVDKIKVFLLALVIVISAFAVIAVFPANTSSSGGFQNATQILQKSTIEQYPTGSSPLGGTYDPYNQELYITNSGSNNITVINSFSNASAANIAVGTGPCGITYVPYNHDLYVDNFASSNISVVSSVTNRVVATITLSGNPRFSTYDPQSLTLYVSGETASVGALWVINVTSNNVQSTVNLPSGASPFGLAFDPFNGYVYVADNNLNDVYAISPSGQIVATIGAGQNPHGMAFDPVTKMLYVSDYDSNALISGVQEYNVTIINTVTNQFVKNVVPGTYPSGVTYDPVNGYVYISNYGSRNVSVLDPASESIVGTLSESPNEPTITIYDPVLQQVVAVGIGNEKTLNLNSAGGYAQLYFSSTNARSIAYDPQNGFIYVASTASLVNYYTLAGKQVGDIQFPGSDSLSFVLYANGTLFVALATCPGAVAIINPQNNSITKTLNFSGDIANGLAYDSINNTLFVSLAGNNAVAVYSLATGQQVKTISVGTNPAALTYSNITNQVYVAQDDANINIINASSYTVTAPYYVDGSYPSGAVYDKYTNSIYIANSGNDSMFIISESQINYTCPGSTPFKAVPLGSPQQSLIFNPSNGLIYVMRSGTDNVTIFNPILNETVGSIYSTSLNGAGYMTYIPSQQIILAADISHSAVYEISPSRTYQVSFSTGKEVPAGGMWNIQVQPSADSSMAQVYSSSQPGNQSVYLQLPNGTYVLNLSLSPGSAKNIYKYFVVNGSSESFTYYLAYNVTFNEHGLPSGTPWYVNITGETSSGPITSSSYSVLLPNGTYSYSISTTDKVYAPSFSKSFRVNGSSVAELISFSEVNYTVTFNESGLLSGIAWYVNITGQPTSGAITGSNYSVLLPNGTYSYSISSSNKTYAPSYTNSFAVIGASLNVQIKFSEVNYSAIFTESGLPSGITWYVNGTEISGHAASPSTLVFALPNGTYTFTATNLTSYYTTALPFTVTINGINVSNTVIYYHWAYITGTLSPGNASLTVNGKIVAVSSGSFNISVPNGSYEVKASEGGYNTYYDNFTLVAGGLKNLTIVLEPVSKPSSLTSTEIYEIVAVVIAAVVIASVVLVLSRRNKGT